MKKYITEVKPRYQIIIEVQFNDLESVYSSKELRDEGKLVEKRHNISKDYQISDIQLQAYNDLVSNILSIIRVNNFNVKRKYQSKSSYSFYIHVKPSFYEGIDTEPVEVIFRISDHPTKSDYKVTGALIHSVIINFEEFTNGNKIIQKIREICKDLKAGDYSSVLETK